MKWFHETDCQSHRLQLWGLLACFNFFRQEFDFDITQILGRTVLVKLAIEKPHKPNGTRIQFDVLQEKFDGELVYVRNKIDTYQPKRLIEQKTAPLAGCVSTINHGDLVLGIPKDSPTWNGKVFTIRTEIKLDGGFRPKSLWLSSLGGRAMTNGIISSITDRWPVF